MTAKGDEMKLRLSLAASLALLLVGLVGLGVPTGAATATVGTLAWPGSMMDGAKYTLLALDAATPGPQVTIQFSGSGTMATAYCGATSGTDHFHPIAGIVYPN
jgi:hypothetical protein